MKLTNQTVLITGASRGLGAEIARAFAKEGANIVVNYFNSEEKAQQLIHELGEKAIAIKADVRDKQQVNEMVEKAKAKFNAPVTTVINNA